MNDRDLWIAFVRRYGPRVPPPGPDVEQRIYNRIQQVRQHQSRPFWPWLVGLGILVWGGISWLQPQPALLIAESAMDHELQQFVWDYWASAALPEDSLGMDFENWGGN